jgi:hypothetical protein
VQREQLSWLPRVLTCNTAHPWPLMGVHLLGTTLSTVCSALCGFPLSPTPWTTVQDAIVNLIAVCPDLTRVSLRRISLTDRTMTALAGTCPKLTKLCLGRTDGERTVGCADGGEVR